ncbi:MAG: PE-PPE domain-containing protein [Mycobacterium sp.]
MRQAVRSLVVLIAAFLCAVTVAVAYTITSALTLAATRVLIVPGTGTPDGNVVADYRENFYSRYIFGTDPMLPAACTTEAECTLMGINYPASFFPLVIFPGWCEPGRCETWNVSVGTGVANLNSALITALANTDDDIVLAGYSQGGAVVSNELRNLAGLDPDVKSRLSVVVIGNAYNPDGGFFTRLGFLPTLPFFDVTWGPPMPVDTGIPITSIGFEYDPVMYAPLYLNPLSLLNAAAALDTVHGFYLAPNGDNPGALPYGYTPDELANILATPCPGPHCRVDAAGNEYFMIPAKSLPLADLILDFASSTGTTPVVKPFVDLFAPAAKVIIDLGYDWSGDPGVPRTLSFLPFNPATDWVEVGEDLVVAAGEGIEAFLGDLGPTTTIAPSTSAVSLAADPPTPVEASEPASSGAGLVSESEKSTSATTLRLVRDNETTLGELDAKDEDQSSTGDAPTKPTANENEPSAADDPPATKPADTTKPDETTNPGPVADDDKEDSDKQDNDKQDNDKEAA